MPSILNATTSTGLVSSADNSGSLQLATNNGTTAVTIDTSQRVLIGATSASGFDSGADNLIVGAGSGSNGITIYSGNTSTAAINFADGTTGSDIYAGGITYNHNTNNLDFSTTDGSGRMRIDSSGNLLVGTTSVTSGSRFQVRGSTTTDSVVCFLFQNSASTQLLAALNSGQLYTGNASGSPYNNTTGSGANVFVASDGLLQRSTSSLKYKTDVKDATHGLTDLLKLRSVTYKGKNEADGEKTFGGLIAEEVHEAGLTEFVHYSTDGSPDALNYGNMVSLCVKAIQEQQAQIEELKAEVQALKGVA
jgi:hypothetical protein